MNNSLLKHIERVDADTQEVIEQRNDIDARELKYAEVLDGLGQDIELRKILEVRRVELIEINASIEAKISEYRNELHEINADLQNRIAQNDTSNAILRELEEDGEDVSDAINLTETRHEYLEDCREKLREILDRLDIAQLEATTISSINGKKWLHELREEYYDEAKSIAERSNLRFYKAHLDGHIKMVVSRSIEAAYIIGKVSGVNCSMKDIAIASLYHDTGMNGSYRDHQRYSPEDDVSIRKNHSLTSAIHVLEDRSRIEAAGGNADKIALMVYLHSKSSSGVRMLYPDYNVNIEGALRRLKAEALTYGLKFIVDDIGDIAQFKYEAAALRLGDACGHDANSALTQSGGVCKVDYDVPNALPTVWTSDAHIEEAKNAKVTYISPDGNRIPITDSVDSGYNTRTFQTGEGNISAMHVKFSSDNELEFVVDVKNANNAPLCTMKCILERLEELYGTSGLFPHATTIRLHDRYSADINRLYMSFSEENEGKYGRINILCGDADA